MHFDMDWTSFDFPEKLGERIYNEKTLPKEVRDTLRDKENWRWFPIRSVFNFPESVEKDLAKKIRSLYQNEEFFDSLEPYPGIVDLLHELDEQYVVWFCSRPSFIECGSENAKVRSISKYFWPQWRDRLSLMYDKTRLKSDVLVDDSPWVVEGTYPPEWKLLLVDQPTNRNEDRFERVFLEKIPDWKEKIKQILL